MDDFNNDSRLNKHEKRRKNTKSISILLIIGGILIIILLGMWIFGGNNDEESDNLNETIENEDTETEPDTEQNPEEGTTDGNDESAEGVEENEDDELNEEASEDDEDVETEPAEPSDDNVLEAYTGNWEPVGTEQESPQTTTNYSDGSQDRVEIDIAASEATGLNQSNMRTHWVGNGGDQQVIATVGDEDLSEFYRVYISWVDNEGWQPTKVEVLNELDL